MFANQVKQINWDCCQVRKLHSLAANAIWLSDMVERFRHANVRMLVDPQGDGEWHVSLVSESGDIIEYAGDMGEIRPKLKNELTVSRMRDAAGG